MVTASLTKRVPARSRPPGSGWSEGVKEESGASFVGVVVNRPIDQVLTYRAPPRLSRTIQPGQRVRVPLGRGNRLTVGYCVSTDVAPPEGLDPRKLKDVAEVLDPVPLIDGKMLALTRWMAEYYMCSWGQALDSAVPAGVRNQSGTRVGTFLLVPEETRQALKEQALKPRLSPKQAAALEVLCRTDGAAHTLGRLPASQVHERPGSGVAPAGPGALGAATALFRARRFRARARVGIGDGDLAAGTEAGSGETGSQAVQAARRPLPGWC